MKLFFWPGILDPSPAGCSGATTFKNRQFYKIPKTLQIWLKHHYYGVFGYFGTSIWDFWHDNLDTGTIASSGRLLQIFDKPKIGIFVTAHSYHMIALWLWNWIYIFILPRSTRSFNPIVNWIYLTHFGDSAKTSKFGCKGPSTSKIGRIWPEFDLSKISNFILVYGVNDVF